MKPRIRRALLFLLLGTAINIAIAWTAVLTTPAPAANSSHPGWSLPPPPEWCLIDPVVPPHCTLAQSGALGVTQARGWTRQHRLIGPPSVPDPRPMGAPPAPTPP